jgi:uncharacterized protein (TIGR02266 family)
VAGQERAVPQIAAMRMKLRFPDVDTFIERYAANISRTGLFIATRQPKPVGTQLKFEILLTGANTEQSVLRGEGRVQVTREYDPAEPQRSAGMAVKISHLDEGSRAVMDRVLAFKARQLAGAPQTAVQPSAPIKPASSTPVLNSAFEGRRTEADAAALEELAVEWNVDAARVAQILAEHRRPAANVEAELDALLQSPKPMEATLEEALRELPLLLGSEAPVIELEAIPHDEMFSDELGTAPRSSEFDSFAMDERVR